MRETKYFYHAADVVILVDNNVNWTLSLNSPKIHNSPTLGPLRFPPSLPLQSPPLIELSSTPYPLTVTTEALQITMPDRGAVFKPQLDDNLPPIRNVTLAEWNAKFNSRSGPVKRVACDIFALTGRYTDEDDDDDREYRARFDVNKCKVNPSMKIYQGSDIDSVIGILPDTLPVRPSADFHYYMVPDARFTLDSNLHIPGVHVLNREMEDEVSV